jgi:hypothetical protein
MVVTKHVQRRVSHVIRTVTHYFVPCFNKLPDRMESILECRIREIEITRNLRTHSPPQAPYVLRTVIHHLSLIHEAFFGAYFHEQIFLVDDDGARMRDTVFNARNNCTSSLKTFYE